MLNVGPRKSVMSFLLLCNLKLGTGAGVSDLLIIKACFFTA